MLQSKKIISVVLMAFFITVFLFGCKIRFPNQAQNSSFVSVSESVQSSSTVEASSLFESSEAPQAQSQSQAEFQSSSEESKLESTAQSVSQESAVVVQHETSSAQDVGSQPNTASSQSSQPEKQTNVCTFAVRCDTVLKNMDLLNPQSLRSIIPQNGLIYPTATVEFQPGETVLDLTKRLTNTVASGGYIQGINNLFEKSCGSLSGWTYRVNGKFLQTSSNKVPVEDGATIEWLYTCDNGRDLQ